MMGPPMKRRSHAALEALEGATLEELQLRFPDQWIAVGEALVAATATRRPEAVAAFLVQARGAFPGAAPRRARAGPPPPATSPGQRQRGHEGLASAGPRAHGQAGGRASL